MDRHTIKHPGGSNKPHPTMHTSSPLPKNKRLPLENHEETLHQAQEGLGEMYEEGKRTISNMIETKPLSSLLVAGGIGFVLSVLLGRNHH